jgi:hypothetical protein
MSPGVETLDDLVPNKRIKLARQGVAARRGRGARSLSAVRSADPEVSGE